MNKLSELINKICPNGVEYKQLEKCCNILDNMRKPITKSAREKGNYPYYGANGIQDYVSNYIFDGKFILVGEDGSVINRNGNPIVTWAEGKIWVNNHAHIIEAIEGIQLRYLYYYIQTINVVNLIHGNIPKLNQGDFRKLRIAVPPMEVQCEIIKILDKFTELEAELEAELEKRRKQYEYYRNKLLKFDETANPCSCTHGYSKEQIKWIELGNIGYVRMCKRILKSQTNTETGIPFYKIGTFGKKADAYISEKTYNEYKNKYKFPKKGDILISCSGTIGRIVVYNGEPAYFQDSNIVWLEHDESIVLNKYLKYCYLKNPWNVSTGGTIARLYNDNILKTKIPVPSLEMQEKIANILDKFEKLCNDISEGLPAEIEARQKQYEYYRDKLLTFKELKVNE